MFQDNRIYWRIIVEFFLEHPSQHATHPNNPENYLCTLVGPVECSETSDCVLPEQETEVGSLGWLQPHNTTGSIQPASSEHATSPPHSSDKRGWHPLLTPHTLTTSILWRNPAQHINNLPQHLCLKRSSVVSSAWTKLCKIPLLEQKFIIYFQSSK